MDIVKIEDEYNYTITTTTPGLYFITAEVENSGITYSDAIAILVMDEVALDAMLQAKWSGMKNALNEGDIEGALKYVAEHRKEIYDFNFQLMSSHLSEISASYTDIQLDNVQNGSVDYEMWTELEGQSYNFLVRFIKDKDGIWRLYFF